MDRRAVFFVIAAVTCALLVLPSDADLRWVPTVMAISYAVLALLSYLDFRSRRASNRDVPNPGAPQGGDGQPNRPVT